MYIRDGIAIVLSWPATYCKQAGSWYDPIMKVLKINKNNYYRAGHSAIILVDSIKCKCYYFDFGRYHAPAGYGRVRDEITDHDLLIKTIPQFSSDGSKLNNIDEILQEIFYNEACHGNGRIYASVAPIHFKNAYRTARKIQASSPQLYGPFILTGTNCSRFVRNVLLAGKPPLLAQFLLCIPVTLSPTPNGNVISCGKVISFNENFESKNIRLTYL